MVFYHFTDERRWESIKRDRALRATESNISPLIPEAGPNVVWLLDVDDPLVGVDPNHDLPSGLSLEKTTLRITVDLPAIKWTDWAFTTYMTPGWREAFVSAGGGVEASEHWYLWPCPIYRRRWLSVVKTASGEVLL